MLTNDIDVDGDGLTAVLDTSVTTGTLTLNSDGSFVYTPTLNFCGTDSFSYHANDGQADSNTATVILDVTCVNDAPVANNDGFIVPEDSSNTLDVLANDSDVDGDVLDITAVTSPTNGTATISGTVVLYTPAPDFFGTDMFSYEMSDGVLTDTATVSITVSNINDAPTAVDDSYTVGENSSNNLFDVLANDVDLEGDSLTLVAVGGAANGTAVISDTTILYTPHQDFIGTDSFTYTVTDGTITDTATVVVTIEPVSTGFTIYLPFVTKQ